MASVLFAFQAVKKVTELSWDLKKKKKKFVLKPKIVKDKKKSYGKGETAVALLSFVIGPILL